MVAGPSSSQGSQATLDRSLHRVYAVLYTSVKYRVHFQLWRIRKAFGADRGTASSEWFETDGGVRAAFEVSAAPSVSAA